MACNTPKAASNTPSTPTQANNADDKKVVIIYDPLKHNIYTEKQIDLHRAYLPWPEKPRLRGCSSVIGPSCEVPLPKWRNWVNIYVDHESRHQFVSSIHMGQLGLWKNLQRRLRLDYTALYVKGKKP